MPAWRGAYGLACGLGPARSAGTLAAEEAGWQGWMRAR